MLVMNNISSLLNQVDNHVPTFADVSTREDHIKQLIAEAAKEPRATEQLTNEELLRFAGYVGALDKSMEDDSLTSVGHLTGYADSVTIRALVTALTGNKSYKKGELRWQHWLSSRLQQ